MEKYYVADEVTNRLTIAASAHDFLLLAQRKEDPDTLFSVGACRMEGDTGTSDDGQNALDAIGSIGDADLTVGTTTLSPN